ncbi:MAG: hypothetical protein ACM3NF_10785, partial [Gemmatimonadota bacterium]
MRRPTMAALAILFFGTMVLPGCLCVGPTGWEPDRDERWKRRRDSRRRPTGPAVTPRGREPSSLYDD